MIFPLAQSSIQQSQLNALLFYCLALLTGGSAVALVLSQNIVRNAVWLLLTLVGLAGFYFLLDAEFLAAVQLVIYVGGTLILIVFGVMLTSKSPFARFGPGLAEIVIAITIGLVVLGALLVAFGDAMPTFATAESQPAVGYKVATIGIALIGQYVIPFELSSLLLLVVMIGAAYLARASPRRAAPSSESVLSELARRSS